MGWIAIVCEGVMLRYSHPNFKRRAIRALCDTGAKELRGGALVIALTPGVYGQDQRLSAEVD